MYNISTKEVFMANRKRSTDDRGFSKNRYYNATEFEITARRMTSYLRTLVNRRNSGVVTADDVHTYLNREGVQPQQIRTRLSFVNSIFSNGMFRRIGSVASSRPQAKGRSISMYTTA